MPISMINMTSLFLTSSVYMPKVDEVSQLLHLTA